MQGSVPKDQDWKTLPYDEDKNNSNDKTKQKKTCCVKMVKWFKAVFECQTTPRLFLSKFIV